MKEENFSIIKFNHKMNQLGISTHNKDTIFSIKNHGLVLCDTWILDDLFMMRLVELSMYLTSKGCGCLHISGDKKFPVSIALYTASSFDDLWYCIKDLKVLPSKV